MKKIACVILPTYNEARNVEILIPRIFEQADKIPTHELHVLVVDDNSPDGTGDVVRKYTDEYPSLHMITGEKKGLGEAYKRGIIFALSELKSDIVFQMDADLQHDPSLLPLFVNLYTHGFSLVIGSRFTPGGTTDFPLARKLLSLAGNWLICFVGGLPRLRDCTSGYRCIRADLIQKCDLSNLSTRGYSFQSSLLFELLRNGARVVEIPIIFSARLYGKSKLSFRDQLEFLTNLAKIRFRKSHEFIAFCAIGTFGVIVNMGVYIVLTRSLGVSIEIASLIAIETSILSNFFLNNVWDFLRLGAESCGLTKLVRFHTVAALAGVINYFLLLLLVKMIGWSDILANLIGIMIGILINYPMNSVWTWKELERGSPHAAQRFSWTRDNEPSFSAERAESHNKIEQGRK
jgi:dolichol-phosphate mannosyltransferase